MAAVSVFAVIILLWYISKGDIITPIVSKGIVDCGLNANDTDVCIINCDMYYGAESARIYCRDAGTCIINCSGKRCMSEAKIYATASYPTTLNVSVTGDGCLRDASIYLPNGGNATIVANNMGIYSADNLMKRTEIYSDSTDHIWISCIDEANHYTDDICTDIGVYASDAQYLEIFVDDAEITNGRIYCPVNSQYTGPQLAPCIINATRAQDARYMDIYTQNGDGSPKDVLFYGPSYSTGSRLYCDEGSSSINTATGSFEGKSPCWQCQDFNTNIWTKKPSDESFSANPSISSYDDSTLTLKSNAATINCNGIDCLIKCNDTASCTTSIINIQNMNNNKINIICDGKFGCIGSKVQTTGTNNHGVTLNIICNAQYSCTDMTISIQNYSDFNLLCLKDKSCQDTNIRLKNEENVNGKIYCNYLYGCDDMQITTDSMYTQLFMYAYSMNVILDNDVGYLFDHNNIMCSLDKYIEVHPSVATHDYITTAVASKYSSNLLPCNGVEVICGNLSCAINYEFDTLNWNDEIQCYWVNVQLVTKLVCEGECESSPTPDPTTSPTFAPVNPTGSPTIAPSDSPSDAPSIAPSGTPTHSPSRSPSNAPTTSPTKAPTRNPTNDLQTIYDTTLEITYIITNLTLEYVEMLEDFTEEFVTKIINILESNYFISDLLEYKDFYIQILSVNNYKDLSDINLRFGEKVLFKSEILSSYDAGGSLIGQSKTEKFRQNVENDLIDLVFKNNTNLKFNVENKELLELNKEETENNEESYIVVIISVLIILIGLILSLIIKVLNHQSNGKIDNAKWTVPLIYSMQVYDFLSDINFCFAIFNDPLAFNDDGSPSMNIVFYCGIASVIFTFVPYVQNLYYGASIKKQNVIKNNKRAQSYLSDKISFFIALIVISGGTYPSLLVVSSRMFNLDIFNVGLTKNELNRLSKIKIRSTITMENGPQLLTQLIYSATTKQINTATYLAFVGSFLSIIMTVASFYANRVNRRNSEIVAYDIRFFNDNDNDNDTQQNEESDNKLTEIQCRNIMNRKGRKEELQKAMATIFEQSHESIEIGYVTLIPTGLEMLLSHHISNNELNQFNTRYNQNYGINNVFKLDVKPKQYIYQIYKKHSESINNVFRKHFDINDKNFIVQFVNHEIQTKPAVNIQLTDYKTMANNNNNDDDDDNKFDDEIEHNMNSSLLLSNATTKGGYHDNQQQSLLYDTINKMDGKINKINSTLQQLVNMNKNKEYIE